MKLNPKTDQGDHLWYLVQTNPGMQRKATAEIRRAGFRAVLIMMRTEHRHRRTKKLVVTSRPLLDRYVFVRMPKLKPNWLRLRACDGIEAIMAAANEFGEWVPFPIPRRDVASFLMRQRHGAFDGSEAGAVRRGEIKKGKHARLKATFTKGRRVRVTAGPFANFPGLVTGISAQGAVLIELSIFGRKASVEIANPAELAFTVP